MTQREIFSFAQRAGSPSIADVVRLAGDVDVQFGLYSVQPKRCMI
jgi:hypothetical protein